ncbi:cation diffusion facilitator family transporter [[Clostridium] symbiosum]|uniref:cation diffusion facilitator family transporter n=1 Tax=Clostridium symbiosum TaxID=1512 RepID=UPI001D08FFAE|nr:cation diffusion facilitator family transporter [[Clostridium] symbiosum]MCB6610576.1 cation diffusion facilitator family transporter [[Clostridium] symbiosum]MCB6932435.1 cation diffusion facilitator family transporter [[Clostridium] symbiosum]
MIKFLIKRFIKDSDNIKDPAVRRMYGSLCSSVGIGLNICLFIGKYLAGVLSGSIAIMADAFNNLSDAGSSLITLIGFKFAGMKPDAEHPFGHGRIEYISGLAVSAAIILMGVELAKSSVSKILSPAPVEMSMTAIVILVVSVCVKLYMCSYNRFVGRQIDSAAMKATATDSLSDAVATSVVLLAMLVLKFTGVNVDGWCGAMVALFILYAGYSAAKDTLSPLLGQPPEEELINQIRDIALSHSEIVGIHDLVVHDYGPGRLMISFHGEVPGDGNIFELHDVIDQAEKELKEKLGCDAVIHMDPIATNDDEVKSVKQCVAELVKEINGDLSIHDFRMVKGPTHTNLIFDVVVPFQLKLSDREVADEITRRVREKWENYYAVIEIDHSYVL